MALVKIEGKAVEKLIEEVSKGIGTLYRPRAIRKEAEAKAFKKEILANAEAKKILIEGEANLELVQRTKERLVTQEFKRQLNIEEIVEKSIKYLNSDVSDDPVDDDWRTRFFNKSQDISGEDMQEIWAKILAGEVSKPGTVSFRTLEVISNLSPKEAIKFQVACSIASHDGLIWKINNENALDDFDLSYSDLMMLRDAGLIHDNDTLVQIAKVLTSHGTISYIGKDMYQVKNIKNTNLKEYRFNQIAFTTAGKELYKLLDLELNSNYIIKLIKDRKNEGYELIRIMIQKESN